MISTLERLNAVLREVFDDPQLKVDEATTADQVDGWDSLSHVNVLVGVETHFGIRFTPKEALTFKNVGDLARCIEGHLQKSDSSVHPTNGRP